MSKIKLFFLNLFRREEGATALEYVILAAGVAVFLVTALTPVRTAMTTMFTTIAGALTG